MEEYEKHSFKEFLNERIKDEKIKFFSKHSFQKAYYIGAYSKSVINGSYYSDISKKNTTFKSWLSNQIINYRNLDRVFEMAFRFEQKLRLRIRNDSEVRSLAHEVPLESAAGVSNSKISYAFVAGFDDYAKYCNKYPIKLKNLENEEFNV